MRNEEIMDGIKDFAEHNFTSFSPEMIKQINEELDKIRQQILEENLSIKKDDMKEEQP